MNDAPNSTYPADAPHIAAGISELPPWPDGTTEAHGLADGSGPQYVLLRRGGKNPARAGCRFEWPTQAECRAHLASGAPLGLIAASLGCTVIDIDPPKSTADGEPIPPDERQAMCDLARTALLTVTGAPTPAAILNSKSLRGAHLYYRTGLLAHTDPDKTADGHAFTAKPQRSVGGGVMADVIHAWPLVRLYNLGTVWRTAFDAIRDAPIDPCLPIPLTRRTRPARQYTAPAHTADNAELSTLRAALDHLRSDAAEHNLWLAVGMTLHAFGEPGFVLFDEWSAGAAGTYPGTAALRNRWATFAGKQPNKALIYRRARRNGWKP